MKAIIFDMDGVLVDTMKYHVPAWRVAFANEGIDISEKDMYLREGMSFDKTVDVVSEKFGNKLNNNSRKELKNIREQALDDSLKFEIYPGVKNFIFQLKLKGLKLAMVTGASKVQALKVVKDFENVFDLVVTADDVVNSKPAPEPYLKAVKELGLNKEDCIVIENAPLGIQSAKAAGLKVIAIETTLHKKDLHEADLILENHENLFTYLKTII